MSIINYLIYFINFVADNYIDYDDFSYVKPAFRWGFIGAKFVRNLIFWLLSIVLFPIVLIHIYTITNKQFLKFKEDIIKNIADLLIEFENTHNWWYGNKF
jgi:hypothetical protein